MTSEQDEQTTTGKAAARRSLIVEFLDRSPAEDVHVEELAAELGVSLATVRRDLAALREQGQIARTYGGARVLPPARDRNVSERQLSMAVEKERIAAAAAAHVQPGDLLLIDAGTTTSRLAFLLPRDAELRVITNGLGVANELVDRLDIETSILGGKLVNAHQALFDPALERQLDHVHARIAFVGGYAVSSTRGVASLSLDQARFKSLLMARADHVVVLADSSKLSPGYFPYWSAPPGRWRIITDDGQPEILPTFTTPTIDLEVVSP